MRVSIKEREMEVREGQFESVRVKDREGERESVRRIRE